MCIHLFRVQYTIVLHVIYIYICTYIYIGLPEYSLWTLYRLIASRLSRVQYEVQRYVHDFQEHFLHHSTAARSRSRFRSRSRDEDDQHHVATGASYRIRRFAASSQCNSLGAKGQVPKASRPKAHEMHVSPFAPSSPLTVSFLFRLFRPSLGRVSAIVSRD